MYGLGWRVPILNCSCLFTLAFGFFGICVSRFRAWVGDLGLAAASDYLNLKSMWRICFWAILGVVLGYYVTYFGCLGRA